jgi:hypothetical protein
MQSEIAFANLSENGCEQESPWRDLSDLCNDAFGRDQARVPSSDSVTPRILAQLPEMMAFLGLPRTTKTPHFSDAYPDCSLLHTVYFNFVRILTKLPHTFRSLHIAAAPSFSEKGVCGV